MKRLFMDTEFTGLHMDTNLISIGLIDDYNNEFYAEFPMDFSNLDQWIIDNVVSNLLYQKENKFFNVSYKHDTVNHKYSIHMKDSPANIAFELKRWLEEIAGNDKVEIWSDCLAYDWVLFNNLFGGAFDIPSCVYYIPFDICTLFKINNIDPDISREKFCERIIPMEANQKHNSLHDAKIIRGCYNILTESFIVREED